MSGKGQIANFAPYTCASCDELPSDIGTLWFSNFSPLYLLGREQVLLKRTLTSLPLLLKDLEYLIHQLKCIYMSLPPPILDNFSYLLVYLTLLLTRKREDIV